MYFFMQVYVTAPQWGCYENVTLFQLWFETKNTKNPQSQQLNTGPNTEHSSYPQAWPVQQQLWKVVLYYCIFNNLNRERFLLEVTGWGHSRVLFLWWEQYPEEQHSSIRSSGMKWSSIFEKRWPLEEFSMSEYLRDWWVNPTECTNNRASDEHPTAMGDTMIYKRILEG